MVQPKILLFPVLLLVCGACGGRHEEEPTLDVHTQAEVDDEQVGQTFDPPRFWAMKQVVTTLVVVPFNGETEMAAQTASYTVMEWEVQGDGSIIQHEHYCWSEISEVAGMTTSLPEAFYDAANSDERDAVLSDMTVGSTYIAADHLSLYGAELDDPVGEALPTSPDDPRVVDFEGDGKPGFTAIVSGWLGTAEAYMAQRSVTTMQGQLLNQGRIEGGVTQTLEQQILDADKWWAAMDGFQSVPDPEPSHNYFVLKATDGEMTCDELAGVYTSFFE